MYEAVRLKDITISYDGNSPVIEGASCVINKGSKVGIIGPNGAGKSTLMKAIVGLLPFKGEVEIFGKSLKQSYEKVVYLPQQEEIDWKFPVSVFDVVMMGRYVHLGWFKGPTKEDYKIVEESLKEVDLWEYRDRQVGKLSGGQRQRVFLARALAQKAEIFLLDEPFEGVDQETEERICDFLDRLSKEGKTVIVVHHDLKKAKDYFDDLIMINHRIVAYGPTSQVFIPTYIEKTFSKESVILEKGLVILK
ncbi:metal ABC transporter ATP-binding protein [Halonatronum saccharophilum]|uniref:metal ABC transporter ATP-binding protein n=1 Tax=Halonatronum saccharophilum TaxID=150060 RepID=UPI000481AE12|nr:metal ABC transporter ATP-binding protein [Halonatronum saccharophilum]